MNQVDQAAFHQNSAYESMSIARLNSNAFRIAAPIRKTEGKINSINTLRDQPLKLLLGKSHTKAKSNLALAVKAIYGVD